MSFCRLKPKPKDAPSSDEDARLEHLLDVATAVFLQQGFYSRFPTKDELFVAVIARKCNLLFKEASARILSGGTIAEVLIGFSRALVDRALSSESIALYRIVYMESGRFPALGSMFYEAGPARGLDLLGNYVKDQMDAKKLRNADPAMAAAHFLDMTVARLVTKALLGINPNPSEKERTKVIESAADVFIRAYRPER